MFVTVLSALARLDLDPWDEAERLARLPKNIAAGELAGLIAALHGGPGAYQDPKAIAHRLIELLPRRRIPDPVPDKTSRGSVAVLHSQLFHYSFYYLAILIIVLLSRWFVSDHQAPVDKEPAPASNAGLPHPPPSNSGR